MKKQAKPKKVTEKSLLVYVANPSWINTGAYAIHPVRHIANDTNEDGPDEDISVWACKRFLIKAGCPEVGPGEVKRVRVTIREVK